jgi:hypothetical protein
VTVPGEAPLYVPNPTPDDQDHGYYEEGDLTYYSVFQMTEAEVDEKTLLGPTYRLVCNPEDGDGRWLAKGPQSAILMAAQGQGRDEIYAAVASDAIVIERWPLAIREMAGG